MITAKVIEDSVAHHGGRLTTLQLSYPRMVHSELMTHRVFSRNASSSRAIPVAKMIEQVRENPAMPVYWGSNKPGMQAGEEVENIKAAKMLWLRAASSAAAYAREMSEMGLHKQIANRVLEPFQTIHVVLSSTEWDNFFALRCHPDAQPEIQVLACAIRDAMQESIPKYLDMGEWHAPYMTEDERKSLSQMLLLQSSAARCARVSYLKHDGANPSLAEDLALFGRLAGGEPIHASPTEHQATPLFSPSKFSKNFRGWRQFRDLIEIQ